MATRPLKLAALWIAGTLAACVIALPWLAGTVARARLGNALVGVGEVLNVKLESRVHESGWFDSRVDVVAAAETEIGFRLHLAHVPVLRDVSGRSEATLASVFAYPRHGQDTLGSARLHVNGDWSVLIELTRTQLRRLPIATWVDPGPLRLRFDYDASSGRLSLLGSSPRARLVSSRLENVVASGDYRMTGDGSLFGETVLRAASLTEQAFETRVLDPQLTLNIVPGHVDLAVDIGASAREAHILGERFGALRLTGAVRGLPVRSLRTWRESDDYLTVQGLRRLADGSRLRVHELVAEDALGARLLEAKAHAALAHLPRLDVALNASEPFVELVFRHATERTLGSSSLFGELNELSAAEQRQMARASAQRQVSVLAARGFLNWRSGRYHARLTYDRSWRLNGRRFDVR